jgi:nicotinamidase/pyrazinamidase
MMNHALILVDIQNDFIPGGTMPVPDGDAVVTVANQAMDAFDIVIATQDWHVPDHISFASQHQGRKIGDVIELNGLKQILWPDHCVQGTIGAAFVAGLNLGRINKTIHKGTDRNIDSYSGFFDNGRIKSTGLGEFLKEQGVRKVAILGLATDYCVKFTALDARNLGFSTDLIIEGVRGIDVQEGDSERAIQEMKDSGVHVVSIDDL